MQYRVRKAEDVGGYLLLVRKTPHLMVGLQYQPEFLLDFIKSVGFGLDDAMLLGDETEKHGKFKITQIMNFTEEVL